MRRALSGLSGKFLIVQVELDVHLGFLFAPGKTVDLAGAFSVQCSAGVRRVMGSEYNCYAFPSNVILSVSVV